MAPGDARLLSAVFRDGYDCACGFISIAGGSFAKEIDVAVGQANSFYHRPALQVAPDGTLLVVSNASYANRYVEVRYMTRTRTMASFTKADY
ncbi:hypothetical protein [Sinorhizobium meliloti]|uniref:hypothetical protein n=1 Tax=Rhizobium meliloti TaxID=382 RepID=UPI000FD9A6F5|nr:hypothetical protein [Sinorhizobium meliloti]RVE91083.1 hypothetical protein CN238_08435 [Sinorhizobium meliloti]RVH34146.1 hypothetical protein CN214_07375 [Sinorhizobium meliloti]